MPTSKPSKTPPAGPSPGLRKALLEATPEEVAQAVRVTAKLLAIRARRAAAKGGQTKS